MSMKTAWVVIGCTRKIISSRNQEIYFAAERTGENSPAILCIIWVISVQPRQIQMHAGGGTEDEKSVAIR